MASALPRSGWAQSDGTSGDVLLGGVLATYSGATFGLLGGLIPCERTLATLACARTATAVGALAGLVSGLTLGHRDAEAVRDRLRGSAYGTLVGTVVGVGLRRFVRQYGWLDVVASAGLGGAVGASATGAGVGFLAGAVPAVILWKGIGAIGLSDAVAVSLGGVAVGGLVGWVWSAADGGQAGGARVSIPFSLRL